MNTQNKILLGIGFFVGIMLLVLWIVINEPVRMEVFTQQWNGRSVERGAELYLNNCSSCHGQDALGLAGVAPALKNPYLFLEENPARIAKSGLDALIKEKGDLESALQNFESNAQKLAEKQKEFDAAPEDKKAEIQKEIDSLNAAIRLFGDRAETEKKISDLTNQIAEKQAELDGLKALGWDETRKVRLKEMDWKGTLDGYLRSTLVSGRPLSIYYGWPGAMPAWGEQAGGPLRQDEIENLVKFLMDYKDQSLKLTPNDIRQDFKLPAEKGASAEADKVVIGENADIMALDLTGGNAENGSTLYTKYACAGCHSTPGGAAYSFAPTAGTLTRVENVRLKDAALDGYTPAQYLAESILYPNKYIVPGGTAGVMPQLFATQLSIEELRDILAYIETYK